MNRRYLACLYVGVLFAAAVCVTIAAHLLEKSHMNEGTMSILSEADPHDMTAPADQNNLAVAETDPITDTETNTKQPYLTIAQQEISLWHEDGKYYAFLPSACKEAGLEPEIPEDVDQAAVIRMYSEHIPAVFINTQSGTSDLINTDKEAKEAGEITVLEPDGTISLQHSLEYIKGRGNTSYTEFDKKPYQIKLPDSIPFLGMESGKKWIFISNSADSTLIRNALSRNLAKYLGLAQSEEGTFVDLYLNHEYMGNYYVVEKIEIQKNRLQISDLEKATKHENQNEDLSSYETAWTDTTKAKQIPKDPEDITGGYLIERDFDNRFLKEVEVNGSYFITESKECFIVRSPEYTSEAQIAYINDYVQSVENAILSAEGIDAITGKSYQELIDLDSFVEKYLLEEITANYDGGVASSYFYKDSDTIDGKLYAGPVWDYDVSWGNSPDYLGQISTSPERLSRLASHSDSSAWFQSLYGKPEFYEKVVACYQDRISSYLPLLADEILPMLTEVTTASAEMDHVRWKKQYIENGYSNGRTEQISFLEDYIIARKDFLDQAWIKQVPVHKITLLIDAAVYDTLYVLHDDALPEFPQVPEEYAHVFGWMSMEDGSAPDQNTTVTADMTFQAILHPSDLPADSNQESILTESEDLNIKIKEKIENYYLSIQHPLASMEQIDSIPTFDSEYEGYNQKEVIFFQITTKVDEAYRYIVIGSKDNWNTLEILNEGY